MAKWGIDAGHGGVDSGAVNSKVKEKDINLIVAKEVARLLQKAGEEVVMTRDTDVYMTIHDRCAKLNARKVDYAVSIHHNAGGGDGGEAIHSIFLGAGKTLAEKIVAEFAKTGQNIRKVFSKENNGTDYFGMIRLTKMPCVITEYGFMDNAKDYAQFDELPELLAEAKAIADACLSFIGKSADDEVTRIINAMASAEVIVDKGYWENVLRGKHPPDPQYLMTVFKRLLK